MRLPAFTVMVLGICVELIKLWEQSAARERSRHTDWRFGAQMSRQQLLISGLSVSAVLLLGLVHLAGWESHKAYLGQIIPDVLFGALALALLFFGLLSPSLLPRVDEAAMLAVHITVVSMLLLEQTEPALGLGIAVGVMTLPLLWVGISQQTASPVIKALLYLWYLISLLILTLRQDFSAFTEPISAPLALLDAFIAGSAGVFLVLHSLFLLRFALMASSLIVPRNRRYIAWVMPRLVSDRQVTRWQLIGLPLLVAGLLLLNSRLDLLDSRTLASGLVLLLAQGLPSGTEALRDPQKT